MIFRANVEGLLDRSAELSVFGLPLERYLGHFVGSGHCVALVEYACAMPVTAQWKRGALVRGKMDLPPGTVIATFDAAGKYENDTKHGRSHAAIYVGQNEFGLHVVDQWLAMPAHFRTIVFHGVDASIKWANNGDLFYVVET